MNILYPFPEPLPLPRARGIQAIHTVSALAGQGIFVCFIHAPDKGSPNPFTAYGLKKPPNVRRNVFSRKLPGPLALWPLTSNKLFQWRLFNYITDCRSRREKHNLYFVRHLKLAAALLDRYPETPLVYEAHEVFSDVAPERKQADLAVVEERVLMGAAAVVTNSQATADAIHHRFKLTRTVATVIPNGVARPAIVPEKPWGEPGRHIVYAGSFFGWKGADVLVRAAAHLPGCRITLIGGTPEKIKAFQKEVSPDGAEVVFAGRLSHGEVMEALSGACIAVLPNRADPDSAFTSPIKLFEYMGAGCAVAASDLPPFREILSNDEASWAEAGNAESLAAAIRRLIDNPDASRAMAEGLRERSKEFTWEKRGERLAALFKKTAVGG